MGGVLPTESNIQLAGPGVIIREASGAGLSSRASFASLRALLSAITTAEAQALIDASIAALVGGAPGALDTLDELAAALGDDANAIATLTNAIAAKYTKPGTGIPSSDLATAVQTSLGKADSALQSLPSHSHGNITNAGAIGSTAGVPIITGASGLLQAGSFGTTAGTFAQGNDSRLASVPKGFRAVSGHYYATHGLNNFSTAVSMVANTLYLMPFRYRSSETFTKLWTYVQTAGTGGTARLGVYTPDASGDGLSVTNATLLLDAGTVSVTTTGVKEITGLSLPFVANQIYWLALLANAAWSGLGSSMSGANNQFLDCIMFGQTSAFNFYPATIATVSQAYGSLPSTLSGIAVSAANVPAIGVRL